MKLVHHPRSSETEALPRGLELPPEAPSALRSAAPTADECRERQGLRSSRPEGGHP